MGAVALSQQANHYLDRLLALISHYPSTATAQWHSLAYKEITVSSMS